MRIFVYTLLFLVVCTTGNSQNWNHKILENNRPRVTLPTNLQLNYISKDSILACGAYREAHLYRLNQNLEVQSLEFGSNLSDSSTGLVEVRSSPCEFDSKNRLRVKIIELWEDSAGKISNKTFFNYFDQNFDSLNSEEIANFSFINDSVKITFLDWLASAIRLENVKTQHDTILYLDLLLGLGGANGLRIKNDDQNLYFVSRNGITKTDFRGVVLKQYTSFLESFVQVTINDKHIITTGRELNIFDKVSLDLIFNRYLNYPVYAYNCVPLIKNKPGYLFQARGNESLFLWEWGETQNRFIDSIELRNENLLVYISDLESIESNYYLAGGSCFNRETDERFPFVASFSKLEEIRYIEKNGREYPFANVTKIEELSQTINFKAHPNPSNGVIYLPEGLLNSKLQLYDLHGKSIGFNILGNTLKTDYKGVAILRSDKYIEAQKLMFLD